MSTDIKERLFIVCTRNLEISARGKKGNFTVNYVKIIQGNVCLLLKQLKQSATLFIYVTSPNSCLQKLTFQTTYSLISHTRMTVTKGTEHYFYYNSILSLKMHIHILNQKK